MSEWWQWGPQRETERLGFAIIGVGRFGIAVCRELLANGADAVSYTHLTLPTIYSV